VSQMLAMEEHSGDEDLYGLGYWSVTPYVHGRFCGLLLLGV
jgi:hypothetical protein